MTQVENKGGPSYDAAWLPYDAKAVVGLSWVQAAYPTLHRLISEVMEAYHRLYRLYREKALPIPAVNADQWKAATTSMIQGFVTGTSTVTRFRLECQKFTRRTTAIYQAPCLVVHLWLDDTGTERRHSLYIGDVNWIKREARDHDENVDDVENEDEVPTRTKKVSASAKKEPTYLAAVLPAGGQVLMGSVPELTAAGAYGSDLMALLREIKNSYVTTVYREGHALSESEARVLQADVNAVVEPFQRQGMLLSYRTTVIAGAGPGVIVEVSYRRSEHTHQKITLVVGEPTWVKLALAEPEAPVDEEQGKSRLGRDLAGVKIVRVPYGTPVETVVERMKTAIVEKPRVLSSQVAHVEGHWPVSVPAHVYSDIAGIASAAEAAYREIMLGHPDWPMSDKRPLMLKHVARHMPPGRDTKFGYEATTSVAVENGPPVIVTVLRFHHGNLVLHVLTSEFPS